MPAEEPRLRDVREELGVAHPSGIDPAHQMTFQLPLTDDLRNRILLPVPLHPPEPLPDRDA